MNQVNLDQLDSVSQSFDRVVAVFQKFPKERFVEAGLAEIGLKRLLNLHRIFSENASKGSSEEWLVALGEVLSKGELAGMVSSAVAGSDESQAALIKFVDEVESLIAYEYGEGKLGAALSDQDSKIHEQKVTVDQDFTQLRKLIVAEKASMDSMNREVVQLKAQFGQFSKDLDRLRDAETASLRNRLEHLRAELLNEAGEQAAHIEGIVKNAITKSDELMQGEVGARIEEYERIFKKAIIQINDNVALAERRREETDKIASLVADKGVTFEFKDRAISEERKAGQWRFLSVLAIASALIWLIGAVFGVWNSGDGIMRLDAVQLIRQAAVTIVLLLSAAYFSKQSAMHRNEGRIAFRTALELNAIGPYLNSLPIEKQHELKEKMAHRFFAQGVPRSDIDQSFEAISVNEFVKAIAAAFKK